MGDATNTVLILAGELLKKAENLLVMGLHQSEVIKGYELACTKALAELECTFELSHSNASSYLSSAPSSIINRQASFTVVKSSSRACCHPLHSVEAVWV